MIDQDGELIAHGGIAEDVTARREAEEHLAWGAKANGAIADVSEALIDPAVGIDDMARVVLAAARAITSSEHGYVSSIDPVTGNNVGHTLTDMMPECHVAAREKTAVFPRGDDGRYGGLWGHCLNTRQGFYTNRPDNHSSSSGVPDGHIALRNLLCVPAVIGDELLGQIALANSSHDYTERDLAACRRLADLYALAIQRHRREEDLALSEADFRSLAESTPDVIMRFDRAYRHVYVSPAVTKLFGRTPGEYVLRTHRELGLPEAECGRWERGISTVFETGRPLEEEFSSQGQRGEVVFDWRLFPEFDDEGKVRSVLSLARNITAHRRSEQDYRTLFREMLDGFALHEIICDDGGSPVDYRFIAINPAFERLTGLEVADVVGKTVREALPGIELKWIDVYGRVALTGEPAHFEEYTEALGKHFEVTAYSPARGQFATIFVDITERKRAEAEKLELEAQLRQSQKLEAVGTLAGGVAHDFNNLLTGILGYANLLKLKHEPDSVVYKYSDVIENAAARASELTKQLLGFARKGKLQETSVGMAKIVRETVSILERTIDKRIKIDVDVSGGPWTVTGDPNQLQQVVMNLAVNARDAMPAGGRLGFSLAIVNGASDAALPADLAPGRYVRLRVTDTGTGIPDGIRDRIFEPFFTTKPVNDGTGMGLAMVYGIVKNHGGTVVVHSERDQGAVFDVFFPAGRSADDVEQRAGAPIQIRGSGRVLVIDDEESIRSLVEDLLTGVGYTVYGAHDGKSGAEYYRKYNDEIDLIILDVTMPEMNGSECFAELRKINPEVKVIVSTGHTRNGVAQAILDAGAIGFVQKPFQLTSLARAVAEALA
jgi:PAS domain S-box-containing protein